MAHDGSIRWWLVKNLEKDFYFENLSSYVAEWEWVGILFNTNTLKFW